MNELLKRIESIVGTKVYMNTSYSRIFGGFDWCEYLHNLKIEFSIFEYDEDVVIATINMPIVTSKFSKKHSKEEEGYMYNMMTAESAELADIADDIGVLNDSISDIQTDILSEDYIYTLESISVKEDFRNLGIGSIIMNEIFNIVRAATNTNPLYIVGIAEPCVNKDASEEEKLKAFVKCNKFFDKLGAKKVSDGKTVYLERK